MTLIIFVLALVALDLAAWRFGVDSRPTISEAGKAVRWI